MTGGDNLGLGHQDHPLLGRLVRDTASGRHGVLRAIAPELAPGGGKSVLRAWLRPPGGGAEWTTDPDAIETDEDEGDKGEA